MTLNTSSKVVEISDHGIFPVIISMAMHPTLHTSDFSVISWLRMTSGAR